MTYLKYQLEPHKAVAEVSKIGVAEVAKIGNL